MGGLGNVSDLCACFLISQTASVTALDLQVVLRGPVEDRCLRVADSAAPGDSTWKGMQKDKEGKEWDNS